MRNITKIFLLVLSILFIKCDKVKTPRIVKNTAVGSNFVVNDNSSVANSRKFMLEDFTGMRCTNCPAAALTAHGLAVQYSNKIIVIAVHANHFAKPYGEYTADYRCDAGEAWYTFLGISSNPLGLINRKNYSGNGQILSPTAWPSVAAIAATDPFVVKLKVKTSYDTTVKALNTEIKATFNTTYTNTVKITAILIEDGIVGKQLDNGIVIDEYEFEHVLRGSINGDFGTDLKTAPIAVNDTAVVSFNNFALGQMKFNVAPDVTKDIIVNDKKVAVVVFASDAVTNEILQVEKVKIR
jgi:hypothetical protein